MDRRRLLLISATAIIALGAILMTRNSEPGETAVQTRTSEGRPEVPQRILVAAEDIPAGQMVRKEQVRWQVRPKDGHDAYLVEGTNTVDDLVGAVARRGLRAGEPVLEGRLVKPGERGFLAAVLEPDMRAVSVPVNGVTGIAGFVFPGDRVDVILTHSWVRPQDPYRQERRGAETVLTNVRVLAIDQRTSDQSVQPTVAKVATLEVTAKQAEWLPLVMELGQLSLALRALDRAPDQPGDETLVSAAPPKLPQRPTPGTRPYSWDSDVSALLPKPGDKDRMTRKVQVIRGATVGEVEFTRNP